MVEYDFNGMTGHEYFRHLVNVWGADAERIAKNLVDDISLVCPTRKTNKELFDFSVNLYSAIFDLGPYNVDEFLA